jgi:hypothetical protein
MPCNASYARFIFGKFFTSTIILYILLFAQNFYSCKKWVLQYLQFSPSGLSKHLRMGSVRMSHHFLTTRMEPWGFINSSAQTYTVHMKLSLSLCFPAQAQPQGLHSGHHCGILSPDHGGLSPIITPPNPTVAPTTSYEYLFCLPSSDRLWTPSRRKA